MSELFYRKADYTSFTPRKYGRERPVFTQYDTTNVPDPSFGETFSAHLGYQWMPITNFVQEQMTYSDEDYDPDFRWQDQEETMTYYNFMNELSRAKNREHYDFIKSTIDQGMERRETMDRGGLFPALVAGIADPLNIAFALPVFNVGVKAAWAAGSALGVAKASGKVGLGFGIASETLRAPFDPMNTPAEVATNIGASTIFSAVLGGGMKGLANTYSHVKINGIHKDMFKKPKDAETPDATAPKEPVTPTEVQRQSIVDLPDTSIQARYGREFNINKVVTDPEAVAKMKLDEGKPNVLGTHIMRDGEGTVYVDKERAIAKFKRLKEKAKDKTKGWAELEKYKDAGVPYAHTRFMFANVDNFTNEKDFIDFILLHEMHHGKVPKKIDEAPVDYEMRINGLALRRMMDERIERAKNPGGLKETPYTRMGFISKFIPARIINESKDVNVKIKEDYNRMSFNASVALEGNQFGKGVQSLSARAKVHGAKVFQLTDKLRERWMSARNRKGTGMVMGIDVASMNVKAERYMRGNKPEGQQTWDEWFLGLVDDHIDSGNPAWREANYNLLPDHRKEAMDDIGRLLREMDVLAREVGALGDDAGIKNQIKYYQKQIERTNKFLLLNQKTIDGINVNAQQRGDSAGTRGKPLYTKKQSNEIKRVEKIIEANKKTISNGEQNIVFLQGALDSPTRKNYKWPIYYNKELLTNSEEAREGLTKVFTEEFSQQAYITRWDDETRDWIEVPIQGSLQNARAEAEKTVSKIIEMGNDLHSEGPRMGKGKHLMMRATNIPEWKVKDYIVKDERVLENYVEKMGFRIEWSRTFGGEGIDDVLKRHEDIMRADGLKDKRIAEIKTNFLADYEREAGQMIREPERWDNKYARVAKKVAGMTYLTGAGVTSIIETVAMPIFEHGFGRVFRTAVQAVDGNWENMKMNARQLMHVNEGMELKRPIAQNKYLSDSVRDVQPSSLESAMESMEKGFYLANGLSIVTKLGKMFDATIRIPKFFDQIQAIKKNTANAFDEEELNRYGITPDIAKRLADMPWENTDSGMPVLNLANWPVTTKLDRDLKMKMMTYLAQGARNTIMHATAFDKPMIMDGFVYAKYKPWMSRLGISIDERASIKVGKNITYPMARIESGVMALPFQFYNFSFAATNRIAASMLDPARQHRLTGMSALLAMSYIVLQLKKPDWWFENKDLPELMMRSFEMSGIMGIYSDIAYQALHSAIATGLHNPDDSWLKGKYKPTVGDQFADFAGATPGLMREWVLGAHELLTDQTEDGLKRLSYNLPLIALTPFAEDMRELGREYSRQ